MQDVAVAFLLVGDQLLEFQLRATRHWQHHSTGAAS